MRAELIQLEKAGYNPAHGEDPYYPADIQAAEAKVAAQNAATGVGGVTGGSSDAGRPAVSKAAGTRCTTIPDRQLSERQQDADRIPSAGEPYERSAHPRGII